MALPYSSHPLCQLRRVTITIALVGIVLCCAATTPYRPEVLVPSIIVLAFSILFCAADVFFYAAKKLERPDGDPEWPLKKVMLGDLIFAAMLQYLFWATIAMLSYSYSYDPGVVGAYAALADFLCSLLHAWCLWKQLIACYKKRWLANLPTQSCARCGYSENNKTPGNPHAYVGPSAGFQQANILTPDGVDSEMEAGLLVAADLSSGYGAVHHAEPIIGEPEEVIVTKGSKKKATASSSDSRGVEEPGMHSN